MKKEYRLYKGLQKPLVLLSFKGRYIYWAILFAGGGVVLGLIGIIVFGFIVGLSVLLIIGGGGLLYTQKKQKEGLFKKEDKKDVLTIFPNKIYLYVKKEDKNASL